VEKTKRLRGEREKKKQWKKKTKGCVGKALLLFPRVLEYFIYYL